MNEDAVAVDLSKPETALNFLAEEMDAVRLAEDHLLRKQQARDALICIARRTGVSVVDLAARTELSVQRIYQILAS